MTKNNLIFPDFSPGGNVFSKQIRIIQGSYDWTGYLLSEDETHIIVADRDLPFEREWIIPKSIAKFEEVKKIPKIQKKIVRFKKR